MLLGPYARKVVLAIHITASVGWIGAVAGYLVLDITVATSEDAGTLRAAWIAMGIITSQVIVPLGIVAFATGILISLGTKWGLFRHYWVVLSLALTAFALVILLVEAQLVADLAAVAGDGTTTDDEVRDLPNTLFHSAGGLVVLIVVQVLNVFKPKGLTKYGWRKQNEGAKTAQPASPIIR